MAPAALALCAAARPWPSSEPSAANVAVSGASRPSSAGPRQTSSWRRHVPQESRAQAATSVQGASQVGAPEPHPTSMHRAPSPSAAAACSSVMGIAPRVSAGVEWGELRLERVRRGADGGRAAIGSERASGVLPGSGWLGARSGSGARLAELGTDRVTGCGSTLGWLCGSGVGGGAWGKSDEKRSRQRTLQK